MSLGSEAAFRVRTRALADGHRLVDARLDVYVVNRGDEGPYLGDHASVYTDAEGRRAEGSTVVVLQDWATCGDSRRRVLADRALRTFFADIERPGAGPRVVPPGTGPSDELWAWVGCVPPGSPGAAHVRLLAEALEPRTTSQLLVLGDAVVAALTLLDTAEHWRAAGRLLGPVGTNRFAALRGFTVLLGENAHRGFRDDFVLPPLPAAEEWGPAGERVRFLVADRLGWDPWLTF